MMNFLSYIFPQKIDSVTSKFNGKIDVYESFGKKYIEVGGLMQSGSFVEKIFAKGFQKLKLHKLVPQKILLLGLGGGSVVHLLRAYFPLAHIIGIEIDPVMINLGRKHFKLQEVRNLEIKIEDIFKKSVTNKHKFDLVIVDIFKGYVVPQEIANPAFLKYLSNLIDKNGILIFNHLYFRNYISEAKLFLDKLQKIFQDVKGVKVYSNLIIQARHL